MSSVDRDALTAFLSVEGSQRYVPQSGEITGILKQMKDTMEKNLADCEATEAQAIKDYDGLMAAKAKEIATNQAAIETKTERLGQVKVDIVNLKEELDDTTKALRADRQFLANLGTSCDTKQAEWEARSKTRSEELAALAETIRLLNDDDALDLFKKTLPSPSLIQMQLSNRALTERAVRMLKAAGVRKDPRLDLVMVALLGKEQTHDDDKKAYCEAELDKAEDEKKAP